VRVRSGVSRPTRLKKMKLATAKFSIPPNASATVKLTLSSAARRLLARAKRRRLATDAKAVTSANTAARKITLTGTALARR
jgi:hypothetical protein